MADLLGSRRLSVPLALALLLVAPFGPRPVVAGAAALIGNAADDHAHRVSVRTSGVCADVVLEHDAAAGDDAAARGASHEHREICLSRASDALLSKLSATSHSAFGTATLAALRSVRAASPVARAARFLHCTPLGLRALRTVVLQV